MRRARIEVHDAHIPSAQRLIEQRGLGYLAFFSGTTGYHPTSPNPNVVPFATWAFDLSRLEEDYDYRSYRPTGTLELFLPPDTVTVPNVIGMQVQDALSALGNVFLNGTVSLQDQPLTIPYNAVVSQSVAAGSQVGQGTIVNLIAQDLTVVPPVIGLLKVAAIALINAAFLAESVIEKVSALPLGTVIDQSPAAASGAFANSVVTITVAIKGDGFRVQAVTAGWYNGTYYNVGDVFDLLQAADFSDASQNYESGGGEYAAGWMIQSTGAVTLDDGNAFFPAVDPNRRFVE